jgi:hypothetical protein
MRQATGQTVAEQVVRIVLEMDQALVSTKVVTDADDGHVVTFVWSLYPHHHLFLEYAMFGHKALPLQGKRQTVNTVFDA